MLFPIIIYKRLVCCLKQLLANSHHAGSEGILLESVLEGMTEYYSADRSKGFIQQGAGSVAEKQKSCRKAQDLGRLSADNQVVPW